VLSAAGAYIFSLRRRTVGAYKTEGNSMTCRVVRNALFLAAVTVAAACGGRSVAPAGPPARPEAPPITDGRSLVSAMRQKYNAQWYKTLSFTQNNTLYSTRGGATTSQWRQHIAVPGRLRIDYMPLTQRSGVLFDGSRVHTFDNGRAIDAQPGVNAQLLITADVYALPVERSAQLLDSLGFDLSKLRRDTWDGQSAYVVGAAAGDSTTSQFWVDSVKLVALRMVQNERRGTRDIVTDVRFGKLTDFSGIPIATEITQYRDGRLVFREQLIDVRVNDAIPDATFDPTKWVAAQPKAPGAEAKP
jgi:hypothetical protein